MTKALFAAISFVAALTVGPVAQSVKPSPTPTPAPALPMPTPKADPLPAFPELSRLKVENALLKANLIQQQYKDLQKQMTDLGAVIQAEVDAFGKANPCCTFNAQTMTVEKKPAPKDGK